MGAYARISKVEIFKEGSVLVIRDRLTIPLADRIKTIRSFETFWITSKDGKKLVKPKHEKKHVIAKNGLTIEISDNEYEKCVEIEDIKV